MLEAIKPNWIRISYPIRITSFCLLPPPPLSSSSFKYDCETLLLLSLVSPFSSSLTLACAVGLRWNFIYCLNFSRSRLSNSHIRIWRGALWSESSSIEHKNARNFSFSLKYCQGVVILNEERVHTFLSGWVEIFPSHKKASNTQRRLFTLERSTMIIFLRFARIDGLRCELIELFSPPMLIAIYLCYRFLLTNFTCFFVSYEYFINCCNTNENEVFYLPLKMILMIKKHQIAPLNSHQNMKSRKHVVIKISWT